MSIIGIKIFLWQNLLLDPFVYTSKKGIIEIKYISMTEFIACSFLVLMKYKYFIGVIGITVFLGQNLLLVPFLLW